MYQKYHTEAFVLGHHEVGESDRIYALFSREFGLVRARAGAVRSEYSKMRYSLQTSSYIDVSLVKGQRGWRAAGASVIATPLSGDALRVFARASRLVLRLVHGEEKNDYLYSILSSVHQTLRAATREPLPVIELVCVARILYSLGYLSADALGSALFTHTSFAFEDIQTVGESKLLKTINTALSETQL